MSYPYEKNKKFIYKWRETHAESYKELNKKHQRKYQAWIKIKKEFLNILLD